MLSSWRGLTTTSFSALIGNDPSAAASLPKGSTAAEAPSTNRSAVAVAMAQQCVNGHEMPERSAFCAVCGSKRIDGTTESTSLVPQVVTGTCANGHVIEASHAYCSVCGGARKTAPVKTEAGGPSANMPSSPSGLSPYARVSIFAVIGVIAIIIVLVVTLGGGGGGGGQSQSYKDGYANGQSQLYAAEGSGMSTSGASTYAGGMCQLDVVGAPNGDNQSQWIQGCEAATSNG
jgi:hypothetical protein